MNILKNYCHRPFPQSFEEFKHAMVSYSQFGEDLLVQEILGYDRKDVFYIELGAYQPISKSNTYIFYKRLFLSLQNNNRHFLAYTGI